MSLIKSLTEKPWETKGLIGGLNPKGAFDVPAERVALTFFLCVASILFSLFLVSYYIRMEIADWIPLAEPGLLWVNTLILVISSALFQLARSAGKTENQKLVKIGLIAGGLFAFAFIFGQLIAWQQLYDQGYFLASNPANSFFYILTGLHGIHLLGGLWVWSRSSIKLLFGAEVKEIRLSVELCTIYWHFLLLVWLVLFGILSNT